MGDRSFYGGGGGFEQAGAILEWGATPELSVAGGAGSVVFPGPPVFVYEPFSPFATLPDIDAAEGLALTWNGAGYLQATEQGVWIVKTTVGLGGDATAVVNASQDVGDFDGSLGTAFRQTKAGSSVVSFTGLVVLIAGHQLWPPSLEVRGATADPYVVSGLAWSVIRRIG